MNNKQHSTIVAIFCICLCAFTALSGLGCADFQGAIAQSTAWRDNAQQIENGLQAQLDTLEDKRKTIDDTSTNAPYLDAAITQANAKIKALNTAIAQADLVIAEAKNPTDSLTVAADAISPWIPAPAQGPMMLGAALIATLVRSRNLKANTVSIIQSLEHTMNGDPAFKQLFTEHANTIRTIQTPGARKMIDSTLRKSSRQPMVG